MPPLTRIIQCVDNAVMQAVFTFNPEFKFVGTNAIAVPVRRARYIAPILILLLNLFDIIGQFVA